jgi:VIT1/CCC1 family predicted Fe2+/Mn2+ transporter
MTLLDRIKNNMYGWERGISNVVPGYKGYKQKEMRREADKLLRETIVSRMRTVKRELDTLQQDLIAAGKIDLLDEVGSTTTQVQTFIDRVRTASYGYGGLFSAVRVKEEDLDRVYQFDAMLLDYVERISSAISRAREGVEGEDARAQILLIRDLAREANTTFDRRQEVINGTDAVESNTSL